MTQAQGTITAIIKFPMVLQILLMVNKNVQRHKLFSGAYRKQTWFSMQLPARTKKK